ncbi:MAG: hypothetical protein Q9159_007470 [Coniocarpon cinnabarinum]
MAHQRPLDSTESTLHEPSDGDLEHVDYDESTPLLSGQNENDENVRQNQPQSASSAVSSLLKCLRNPHTGKRSCLQRWPSVLALALLCIVAVIILALGFVAPQIAKEYAEQAASFTPSRLSIDSYTDTGVVARVQGTFEMDSSRVHKSAVRHIGRFGAWCAGKVEIGDGDAEVNLPGHSGTILGYATIPKVSVSLLNDHITPVDMLVDLIPGPRDGIRQIAKEFVDGEFNDYEAEIKAAVTINSGILRLGKQSISKQIRLAEEQFPQMPAYEIRRLNFREMDSANTRTGIAADVSVIVQNKYPVDVALPSFGFSVAVENCLPTEPHIKVADATTHALHVQPHTDVMMNVTGLVSHLPEAFLSTCPGTPESPFDTLFGNYIHGKEATMFVSGSDAPANDTPQWITDLAYGVTVPISFPGRSFGHLIKNFTMADVHFFLPDYFADPDTPGAQPKISAQVEALVSLPEEMNFRVGVQRIRSTADVFYHHGKLGVLDISKWHDATSREVRGSKQTHPDLLITSHIDKAPLTITDDEIFNEVVRALLTGDAALNLTVKALVDVEMETPLGSIAARQVPAEGLVPVKPIGGSGLGSFLPKFSDLRMLRSTPSSLTLQATVNFTNPTKYTADIPYANVNILVNGTILGQGIVRSATIQSGNNTNIPVEAVWEPRGHNETEAPEIGRNFLSQYISGYNTTLSFRPHAGTIPSQPSLGKALQSLSVEIPTPRLGESPDPGHGSRHDQPHFIKEATMHLVSSSADFVLMSPLTQTTIDIMHLNATAFYHGEAVGQIEYDGVLEVPPGESETPRLPVEWSLGSVGYEAIKNALGALPVCMARHTGSHTSLTHLTLAPLSTGHPLISADDYNGVRTDEQHSLHSYLPSTRRSSTSATAEDEFAPPAPPALLQHHHRRPLSRSSSYLATRSVPTTPGILSRPPSPSRVTSHLVADHKGGSKSFTYLASDKSSGVTSPSLSYQRSAHVLDGDPAAFIGAKRQRNRLRLRQERESSEWLHRHGLALADSARDSKGQRWLAYRTSNVTLDADNGKLPVRRAMSNSAIWRQNVGHSRKESNANQIGHVKTGGLDAGIAYSPLVGSNDRQGYFLYKDMAIGVEGPDFVDTHEEEDEDEGALMASLHDQQALREQELLLDDEVIARLAKQSQEGLDIGGIGTFVDRFVSYTLFDAGPSERYKQEEEEERMRAEQTGRLKRIRDSQAQLDKLAKAEQVRMSKGRSELQEQKATLDQTFGDGWDDAAWLLRAASKALF